jgi:carbon monoxide dehydrogenase subunit G
VRLPARIVLRDAGAGATIVSWSADVEVTGAFAGLVAGLAGREAGRLIDGLVACVERVLASAPGA